MVFFLVLLHLSIVGALIAAATGAIFMFLLLLFRERFIESFNMNFNWQVIGKLLSLGILYAIALLIISLNYKINVILLDRLSTPFELGIYTKGAAITEYLWQIPTFLSTIVFARSANAKDGQLFSRKVTQLLRLSIIAIGIGSLMLIIFSRFIIILLYGNAFAPSIEVLQFLVPGVVLLTIYKVLNMDLAGKGKPWIAIKAMIPSLILNIVLNIYLIPRYGASGAAFTGTVTYSFASVLFIYFYSKEVKLPIKEILRFNKSDFEPIILIIQKIKMKLYEGY
jgi:O-antigen/teichoic acid export membrane protein